MSKAFDVMLDGVRINTVFFNSKMRAAEVKRQLVNQQHYDTNIVVEEVK